MYNVHVHLGFFDYFAKFSTRKLLVEFPIGLIIMISSTACHFVPPLSLQNWKICANEELLLEAKELWNFLLPLNLFLLKVERRLRPCNERDTTLYHHSTFGFC